MSTNFPSSLDTLTNPTATDAVATVDHAAQHANANDAIEALEAKVGANSSAVTTSHDYKLSGVTGSDKAVSKTGTETLTNKTISGGTISGTITDTATTTKTGTLDAVAATVSVGDANFSIKDDSDNTKIVKFQASGITTGTTRTKTFQDVSGTIYESGGTDVAVADGGTGGSTATVGFNNLSPLTTKGDLIVHDGTNNVRKAVGANNEILIADSAQSTGVKWGTVGSIASGKLYISTTPVTVTNTTTLTTLFTTSIAGGVLGTNGAIKIFISVSDLDMPNSGNLTLRLKYGGTTICSFAINNASATITDTVGSIEGYIVADGATGAQKGFMQLVASGAQQETSADAAVGITKVMGADTGTAAVDSTASQTLIIDAQWGSATTTRSITADLCVISSII